MFETRPSVVIAIDTAKCEIHFCAETKSEKNKYKHTIEHYNALPFVDEFFEKLAYIVKFYKDSNPKIAFDKTVLVLPNSLICTDIVSIPPVRRMLINSSLALAINSIYSNSDQLKFSSYPISQTKQTLTFGLVGIRQDIFLRIKKIFSENQINLIAVTYAANSSVNFLLSMNSKLRASSFLYMDVRMDTTEFAFVVKGQTVGFYTVDAGFEVFNDDKPLTESEILSHFHAKRLIASALEKARKIEGSDEEGSEIKIPRRRKRSENRTVDAVIRRGEKVDHAIACENFEIFKKWALSLILSNPTITQQGDFNTVYVNLPPHLNYIFDTVNDKNEEGDIKFECAVPDLAKNFAGAEHPEIYGGLFAKQFNKQNNL